MKIAIASDHGGFTLKQRLGELLVDSGYEVDDLGCHSSESVDYPPYADALCKSIISGDCHRGILVCGSGIGMVIAANRHRQIRAALCHDDYTAKMSREHNDANVLCLGERVTGSGVAEEIVRRWLTTEFAGGRHQQRISQFSD